MSPKQAKRLRKRIRQLSTDFYPLNERHKLYKALKRHYRRASHKMRGRVMAKLFRQVEAYTGAVNAGP